MNITKDCRRCRATLPITEFGPAKNTVDKLQVWCKECRRQYALDRYRQNKPQMDADRVNHYFKQKAKKKSIQELKDRMDGKTSDFDEGLDL